MKRILFALTMIAAALLCGCAAIRPFLPMLAEYGIETAEKLAAKGEVAIAEARKKAESIPDEIARTQALLEVMRAEQMYLIGLTEYLVSCHPPETDAK